MPQELVKCENALNIYMLRVAVEVSRSTESMQTQLSMDQKNNHKWSEH